MDPRSVSLSSSNTWILLPVLLVVLLQTVQVYSTVNDNYESASAGMPRKISPSVTRRSQNDMQESFEDWDDRLRAYKSRSKRKDPCPPGQVLDNHICREKTAADCEMCRKFVLHIVKEYCPKGTIFVRDSCVKEHEVSIKHDHSSKSRHWSSYERRRNDDEVQCMWGQVRIGDTCKTVYWRERITPRTRKQWFPEDLDYFPFYDEQSSSEVQ